MKNKGFTLLEIMSVVIIIGILLLIGIPAITGNIITAREEPQHAPHRLKLTLLHRLVALRK